MKNKESKFIKYDHLDKIGEIAVYYGFTPTKSPVVTKEDLETAKSVLEGDSIDDETDNHGRLPLRVEEKIALLRTYHEENMQALPQPVMLYFKDPCRGTFRSASGKKPLRRYADMEILGNSGAIAEATLIQAARTMLAEDGYDKTLVEVNSVGDRDSLSKFSRELSTYYRKHLNDMPAECRQLFKDDQFDLLSSASDACKSLNEQAPKSLDFLSEASRRHLEELLEYFETLGIPYTINNMLVGNKKYCTETIFTIVGAQAEDRAKPERILAVGVRYNGLAKRVSMKRDLQAVGISILAKGNDQSLRGPLTKVKRPVASFVQLGAESKLLSLDIVEKLRKAKIPLYLSLAKDRLGAQVSTVERLHAPYSIIVGKKEAVERTAIVRHSDTHAQAIVPIDELSQYMKKIEADYWAK